MQKYYALSSATVFALVAILQLVRAVKGWPVQIDEFAVPLGISWLVAALALALCLWGFRVALGGGR